jgi:hypothetical protein
VGPAELVQPRVGELDLGLDADGPADPATRRAVEDVLQQRRLADPGLTAQDQHLAPPCFRGRDQPAQHLAFASSSDQDRRTISTHGLTARTCYDLPLYDGQSSIADSTFTSPEWRS